MRSGESAPLTIAARAALESDGCRLDSNQPGHAAETPVGHSLLAGGCRAELDAKRFSRIALGSGGRHVVSGSAESNRPTPPTPHRARAEPDHQTAVAPYPAD